MRCIASGVCARNSPASAKTTLHNDAEGRSNPAASPYCGFTSDPSSSSSLYYVYPGVRGRLLERCFKTRNREELGFLPQLFLPSKPLCKFRKVLDISRSHLAILPPLNNSNRLFDFDFPDRHEEPDIRVTTTELSATREASMFSGFRRTQVTRSAW